jgi:hypothetical protein
VVKNPIFLSVDYGTTISDVSLCYTISEELMVLNIGRRIAPVAILAGLLATTASTSFGAIIGTLDFAGGGIVTQNALDFTPPVGGGVGQFQTIPGFNTGVFSGLNSVPTFTGNAITDRDNTAEPVTMTPTLNIPNYLTIASLPNLSFTLNQVKPGGFSSAQCAVAPANQQNCTLPVTAGFMSPYNLTNSQDPTTGGLNSTAAFTVNGTATNTATGEVGQFEITFTALFKNQPYQSVIAAVLQPGGSVNTPYAARLTIASTAVPEPSSVLFALSGFSLLGLSAVIRRRRSRS